LSTAARKWKNLAHLTLPEINNCSVSLHAVGRACQRVKTSNPSDPKDSNPKWTDIVLRLGQVIDHPEHIKKGKKNRWVYDDGQYRVVISKGEQKVIATVIADKS